MSIRRSSVRFAAALAMGCALFGPSVARAQPSASGTAAKPAPSPARTTTTTDYREESVGGDQVVTFTGDELPVSPGGAYGDVIRRPPGVTRAGLIRPRMNFVVELLKSVENL